MANLPPRTKTVLFTLTLFSALAHALPFEYFNGQHPHALLGAVGAVKPSLPGSSKLVSSPVDDDDDDEPMHVFEYFHGQHMKSSHHHPHAGNSVALAGAPGVSKVSAADDPAKGKLNKTASTLGAVSATDPQKGASKPKDGPVSPAGGQTKEGKQVQVDVSTAVDPNKGNGKSANNGQTVHLGVTKEGKNDGPIYDVRPDPSKVGNTSKGGDQTANIGGAKAPVSGNTKENHGQVQGGVTSASDGKKSGAAGKGTGSDKPVNVGGGQKDGQNNDGDVRVNMDPAKSGASKGGLDRVAPAQNGKVGNVSGGTKAAADPVKGNTGKGNDGPVYIDAGGKTKQGDRPDFVQVASDPSKVISKGGDHTVNPGNTKQGTSGGDVTVATDTSKKVPISKGNNQQVAAGATKQGKDTGDVTVATDTSKKVPISKGNNQQVAAGATKQGKDTGDVTVATGADKKVPISKDNNQRVAAGATKEGQKTGEVTVNAGASKGGVIKEPSNVEAAKSPLQTKIKVATDTRKTASKPNPP